MKATAVDINCYANLIAWQARIAYNRLPQQTRNWLTVDDLIQEGRIAAEDLLQSRYDPTKSSFSTYLTTMLKSFYLNETDKYFTQKRVQAKDISIDAVQHFHYLKLGLLQKGSNSWDELQVELLGDASKEEAPSQEDLLLTCNKFLLLYKQASVPLRAALAKWFFTPRGIDTKLHTKGKKFKHLREEFLALSKRIGFGPAEFALMMKYAPEYLDIPKWAQENSKIVS